jgi:ATP diphosphatase
MSTVNLSSLFEVIQALLGPAGCPWDKEQTPQSLCDYLLEETYELIEAIRTKDLDSIRDEFGDVLFLLCFLATLFEKDGSMNFQDVLEENASKMIRRHPHVFQGMRFHSREELQKKWEEIKMEEKQDTAGDGTCLDPLDSIPVSLPPLMKAYRMHSKAARAGFTWDNDTAQIASLEDEWREWIEAQEGKDQEQMEEEFGDVLFSFVELGRRKGLKANSALQKACQKFFSRWKAMHRQVQIEGLQWSELSMEEKNRVWEKIKGELRSNNET